MLAEISRADRSGSYDRAQERALRERARRGDSAAREELIARLTPPAGRIAAAARSA
jgi:hypothetical protein